MRSTCNNPSIEKRGAGPASVVFRGRDSTWRRATRGLVGTGASKVDRPDELEGRGDVDGEDCRDVYADWATAGAAALPPLAVIIWTDVDEEPVSLDVGQGLARQAI